MSQEQRNQRYCCLINNIYWNTFLDVQVCRATEDRELCVNIGDKQSSEGNIVFKGEKGINIHSSLDERTMQAYNIDLSKRESASEK